MLFAYVCYDMTTNKLYHEIREDISYRDFMDWIAGMNFLHSGIMRFAETVEELGLTIDNAVVK